MQLHDDGDDDGTGFQYTQFNINVFFEVLEKVDESSKYMFEYVC